MMIVLSVIAGMLLCGLIGMYVGAWIGDRRGSSGWLDMNEMLGALVGGVLGVIAGAVAGAAVAASVFS